MAQDDFTDLVAMGWWLLERSGLFERVGPFMWLKEEEGFAWVRIEALFADWC